MHLEQTGFIPQRHLFFNLWHLLNVMCSPQNSKEDFVMPSLDAEKAFDQVEWFYSLAVL